ncbi:MAG: hypothetical protein R3230_01405 [Nitrosopumilaceae archaeon]|nr:hypothetical protein [Nitrosopumilaceae archaeon]
MTKKHTKKDPLKTPQDTDTLGSQVNKIRENTDMTAVGVGEYIDEAHDDYEKELITCIERGKQLYPDDFYVTILHKTERLMQEVNRFFFMPRLSCPTPTFDQVVYKFHRNEDMLEFLWVVPDQKVCEYYKNNALLIDPSEKELLNFVLDFYEGALDIKCKQMNGEQLHEPRITIKVNEEH